MKNIKKVQALAEENYMHLLGCSVLVFNNNNAFVIENILNHNIINKYSWYELIDAPSGCLLDGIKDTITMVSGNVKIWKSFDELVAKRNRILHSFQATVDGNKY